MKKLTAATVTLLFRTVAPAFAMSCCSGGSKGKGAMMCGKGGMSMNRGGMKGKKASCERMSGNMNKRG